jgi:hypothetical protein
MCQNAGVAELHVHCAHLWPFNGQEFLLVPQKWLAIVAIALLVLQATTNYANQ